MLNEIKRGSVKQIKNGEEITRYFSDAGDRVYRKNRENCRGKYKLLKFSKFIDYVVEKVLKDNLSLDACLGEAKVSERFKRDEMVCTKTLYNYIDLGFIKLKNNDLPMKLRFNRRKHLIRMNKRNLGRSIEERDKAVEMREEFGHWEIDTVEGIKDKEDCLLLTLIERKTLNSIHRKLPSKTACAVDEALANIKDEFCSKFSEVFKTITSDNGSEFANLSHLENNSDTKVYFTHPYSSFEKGCNERHNGLIRRFIPKEKAIFQYTIDEIARIEDWINTFPSLPSKLFSSLNFLFYSLSVILLNS